MTKPSKEEKVLHFLNTRTLGTILTPKQIRRAAARARYQTTYLNTLGLQNLMVDLYSNGVFTIASIKLPKSETFKGFCPLGAAKRSMKDSPDLSVGILIATFRALFGMFSLMALREQTRRYH